MGQSGQWQAQEAAQPLAAELEASGTLEGVLGLLESAGTATASLPEVVEAAAPALTPLKSVAYQPVPLS
jgi:hypothetical protein